MFNSKMRKESKKNLENAIDEQKRAADDLKVQIGHLYTVRNKLQSSLKIAVDVITTFKNTPEELNIKIKKIQIDLSDYKELLNAAAVEYKNANVKAGGTAAAGVAAGVGVATLAPTAVMGLVSSFGTASTGTAIASLSGAAATNATLAAIGGGSIAAGGTGILGGEAVLGLAGPIGWIIGGSALVAGGLLANGKNKKSAEKMYEQANQVNVVTKSQQTMAYETRMMIQLTKSDQQDIDQRLLMINEYPNDYEEMNDAQISLLGTFINNVHSSAEHLNMVIGADGKFKSPKK